MDLDDWTTLRELDTACGQPKGSAFRRFKHLLPLLSEGRDYRIIDAETEPGTAERLQRTGRVYVHSIKLILLSPVAAARIRNQLRDAGAA